MNNVPTATNYSCMNDQTVLRLGVAYCHHGCSNRNCWSRTLVGRGDLTMIYPRRTPPGAVTNYPCVWQPTWEGKTIPTAVTQRPYCNTHVRVASSHITRVDGPIAYMCWGRTVTFHNLDVPRPATNSDPFHGNCNCARSIGHAQLARV